MVLFGIRTSTITSKGQIVIPSELREKEGFRSGQKVAIFAFDERLEVLPFDATEFEARRKNARAVLKRIVDEKGLQGKKIRELTKEEKDKLAMDYFERVRMENSRK